LAIEGCTRRSFSFSPNTARTPTNYSFQRFSALNLSNQYFAATLLLQPADSKDRGQNKGGGVGLVY
jgi:hypothetical protein